MKQQLFQDKYPITVLEIEKSQTSFRSVSDVAEYFRTCFDGMPDVICIGTFDHYEHTRSLGGDIAPEITAALNVLFCFGKALPDPRVLAVRPRSVGIADLCDRFVISFLDAPMKPANDAMQAWAKGIRNI